MVRRRDGWVGTKNGIAGGSVERRISNELGEDEAESYQRPPLRLDAGDLLPELIVCDARYLGEELQMSAAAATNTPSPLRESKDPLAHISHERRRTYSACHKLRRPKHFEHLLHCNRAVLDIVSYRRLYQDELTSLAHARSAHLPSICSLILRRYKRP